MVFRVDDISLQGPLTSLHWSLSLAPESIRKPLVFREQRNRPVIWDELIIYSQPLGKKYDALKKCSKDTLDINDVSILYSLRVEKYNKNEFQNLQDLKETGKSLVMFKFKLGYVEEQLFATVSINFNKNGSFMVDVQQTFIKQLNHVSRDVTRGFRAEIKC